MADNYEIDVTLDQIFGTGISSVEQTTVSNAPGGTNVWTVRLTNGNSYEFHVLNGTAGGDPVPVSSAAEMTDTSSIYLYFGNEEGYTFGHWYFYTDAWHDGGTYAEKGDTGEDGFSPAASVSKSGTTTTISITDKNGTTTAQVEDGVAPESMIAAKVAAWASENITVTTGVVIDQSLSVSGAAADAGAVGEEIADLNRKIDNLTPDLDDGFVTTSKLADHAVTMGKTDFYYSGSLSHNYSWIQKRYYNNSHRCTFKWSEMATILTEFPETLSIVMADVVAGSTNWYQGSPTDLRLSTTSHNQIISRTSKTFTVNGVTNGVMEFKRSDFETSYNALKSYVENDGEGWTDNTFVITNVESRIPVDGDVYFIAGEVTSELIELNFSTTIVSSDFATAVQAVMGGGSSGSSSYDEELAKARLTGKVMINIGDSYTRNMGTFLDAIATKYGMIRDNQGVNNTKVIDHFQSRADTLVTDYTTGKAISGTTYHASDVAIITFMGGANDGGGISTFVGDGLHVTDTTKLYGACHHIFKVLLNTFTNAKLIIIAQPANYNQSVSNITTDAQAQALGFTNLTELQRMDDYQFSEYVMWNKEKAILDVAKAYSLPSIDMFSNFPTMLNPANRTAYWMDSVHINTAGSKLITDALEKKIVELAVG